MKQLLYVFVAFCFLISVSSCAGGRRCMGKGINLSENSNPKAKQDILKNNNAHQAETKIVAAR